MHTARSEDRPTYLSQLKAMKPAPQSDTDDETIRLALVVLLKRMRTVGATMDSPQNVKDYLRLQLASLEHEAFGVLFLDGQHRAIDFRVMFRGTLTQTSVYPREIVKEALALNAAAVVLAHNHPSNVTEPSRADEFLTQTLKTALQLIDVRVIDHVVVGALGCTSMAERGLI